MSGVNKRGARGRRKLAQTLKKFGLLTIFTAILILIVLCIILLTRVHRLHMTLETLTLQLENLTQTVDGQKEQLQDLLLQDETRPAEESAVIEIVQPDTPAPDLPEQTQETNITAKHKVYLTFDDGPSRYTEDILDILDRYDVKATFFVVGKEDKSSRKMLGMIADGGHSLGMHSYSHKYSQVYNSEEDFAEDFEKIQKYIFDATGIVSKIYRFPGGSSNTVSSIPMEDFAEYLDSQEVRFFDWNISSGDGGKLLNVETLVDNCMEGITRRETSIILLHDSAEKSTTVEALPLIIENILALEDTVILPITEETKPIQHIQIKTDE